MSGVIFGAGKIARGFLGHLLYLSRMDFTFVEKADGLADLINRRGQYRINVLGNPEANCLVSGAAALKFSQEKEIGEKIAGADVVFTAVGGKNLPDMAPYLAKGIAEKSKAGGRLNVITCENWKSPAAVLKNETEKYLSGSEREYCEKNVGFTEAVVMRSAIEPSEEQLDIDPLIVNVQDFWELPVDASRIKGSLPEIRGLTCMEEFGGFLERKFYTYNSANGTISYLGALLGFEKIADAAHDERIQEFLDGVYSETARALSLKYGFPLEEQMTFAMTSKRKLQDYTIVDYIERNARDPMRKLGPDDRLVGSARLVLEYGIKPENLSAAIAAAIYYENEKDESAVQLKRIRENEGIGAVLTKVCGICPDGELGRLVQDQIARFKEKGWIKE